MTCHNITMFDVVIVTSNNSYDVVIVTSNNSYELS